MKRILTAVLLSLSAAACGGSEIARPSPDTEELPTDPCVAGTREPDFQSPQPLSGPGVDSQGKLVPGTYMVSTTYLRLAPTPEAREKFQQILGPILETLQKSSGLVAVQLGSSASCGTARTFAVWKSEEAMYEFVGSPAHSQAMSRIDEVSRGGSFAVSWQDDESGATWEKAVQKLAEDQGPTY